MYYYIYDSLLNEGKYRKTLEAIEVRLTDLGIQGKIRRLNILHHQKEVVEESIRRGAKTIVLVGNDRSVAQAIDTLAKHDIAVGLIPIGRTEENTIARALGIPPDIIACDILSRRSIARLDLGKVGTHHFLTHAECHATYFECIGPRNAYRIKPIAEKVRITVTNLSTTETSSQCKSTPRDGVLELHIHDTTMAFRDIIRSRKRVKIPSIFPIQELIIEEPKGTMLTLDGCRSVVLPATITVAHERLRVIVGRERLFH